MFDNLDFNTNSYSLSHIRLSIDGGWVMYHTLRHGSDVGFDMALEKCYNKPAKVAGGIIGMTRQKKAVAL